MSGHSEDFFYLIDNDGNRRVPHKIQARDGRYGYAVHPKHKGNDSSAAEYTEDLKRMVQAVVLEGKGVRARAYGGSKDGQVNTLALDGKAIRGYWLAPEYLGWIPGGIRPEAVVYVRKAPVPANPIREVFVKVANNLHTVNASHSGITYKTQSAVRFAEHCCQGKAAELAAGPFTLDDLTMVVEGPRRLRFSPLGNRPEHPRVALVGITPGGQVEKFASYLADMDVPTAASKAAFEGSQSAIKELLAAHGFAARMGISLLGNLNDNPDVLTTSIVKCCLMVDEGYRFGAPDIAASPAATHCATHRFVKELCSHPTLAWVVVFGEPGWNALNELQIDGKSIIDVLRDAGLKVLRFPHFAQNFQQRQLFVLDDASEAALLVEKPDFLKFAPAAREMRQALLREGLVV